MHLYQMGSGNTNGEERGAACRGAAGQRDPDGKKADRTSKSDLSHYRKRKCAVNHNVQPKPRPYLPRYRLERLLRTRGLIAQS